MNEVNEFNIVVAYDDFAGAVRARQLTTRLAVQVTPVMGINSDSWRFDFLGHPRLRERAAAQAAAADIVIIAADGCAELPAHVKAWLECWLRRRKAGDAALVALLDPEATSVGQPLPLIDYLRQMTERSGLDFFNNAGGWEQARFKNTFRIRQLQPQAKPEASRSYAYRENGIRRGATSGKHRAAIGNQ